MKHRRLALAALAVVAGATVPKAGARRHESETRGSSQA